MIDIRKWLKHRYFNIKYTILLTLIGVHYSGKITDDKLKGQFNALRKGTLQKKRNVYHCEITDRWYNNDSVHEIWEDVSDLITKEIPLNTLIEYIDKFENKGKNYAINVFGGQYLNPLYNCWNPEYHTHSFSDFIGIYISLTYKHNSHTCYLCGHEQHDYSKNENTNYKELSDWLHSMKKGNLSKIPKFEIKDSYNFM